jgi:PAS domain S-box-containing protein
MLAAGVALAFVVLVPGYLGFIALMRERERTQRRAIEMTEDLPAAAFQYRSLSSGGGRYEFFSRSAERLRGVSRAEALRDPESVLGRILEKDRAELQKALEDAGLAGARLQHDFRVHDPDGRIRWIRVTAVPRAQADGVLWTGSWEDVTDRKRMARTIEESNAAAAALEQSRSRFAMTLNHELRTPLSAALGSLELLVRTRLDDEQRAAAYLAYESSKSALTVVEDIADFSRIEAGNIALQPEPVSLRRLIEETAAEHRAAAASKGLTLRHHCDEGMSPGVMADPLRLRQILNNFTSTLLATARQGSVELRAELAESRDGEDIVKLSARATGAAAAGEPREGLFEPFVQMSSEATHRYDGSGLGLVMCQRLARLMGGTVETVSEAGIGRLLVLTLPLPVADPAADDGDVAAATSADESVRAGAGQRTPPSARDARAEGTLILIVDDHPINRMVLLRQANALGYAAECAHDGVEALERWSAGGYALVITDCQMPEMDGYELARNIRAAEARDSRPRVPIIACTANKVGDETAKCFDAGMDDFMAKPITIPGLASKLRRWLPLPGSPLALAPLVPSRSATAKAADAS